MADIPNKKTFNINTNKKTSVSIIPFGLKKSFNITINKKSSFNLVIFGFNVLEKWLFTSKTKLNLAIIQKQIIKRTSILTNKLNLTLSLVKETIERTLPITIKLNMILDRKLHQKAANIFTTRFDLLVNRIQSIGSRTSSSSTRFDTSLTFENRLYYPLSAHDTKTLAEMDVLTLEELDYQVV